MCCVILEFLYSQILYSLCMLLMWSLIFSLACDLYRSMIDKEKVCFHYGVNESFLLTYSIVRNWRTSVIGLTKNLLSYKDFCGRVQERAKVY